MKSKIKNVILYHGGCTDGFGAAWAAWKKFGDNALYIGMKHDHAPPDAANGNNVYLLDFSFPVGVTKKLLKTVNSLIIIDHHVSVKQSTKLADDYSYSINNSGAVLAWRYFHPSKKVPKLLLYIEDVDIWKLKLPRTMELGVSLRTYPLEFKVWNKLARDWESAETRGKYAEEGACMVRYEKDLVEHLLKDTEPAVFFGKRALVVNAPVRLASQIGEDIRKKGFRMAIIWQKKGNYIVVSLRSADKVDSSKIAAKFGGGGHKNAAAFRLSTKIKFPWKSLKK